MSAKHMSCFRGLLLAAGISMAALGECAVWAETLDLGINGDFEAPSEKSPPPGWSMWGPEQWKNPANFTRDANNPHSGQACFRIHHPANTAGYVVSSPEWAIRPQRGKCYTVSFWARSDHASPSIFGLTAYASVRPFVDAPSPGSWPLEVGLEWRQFTFTLEEGWDFFADRNPYLLLTFWASRSLPEAKTLWVDDLVVREEDSPRKGRLVDEFSLQYEPLQHRLVPGDRLEITADAAKRLRRTAPQVGGVSFHRLAGWTGQPYNRKGEYTLHPELEQAIRDMRLPMTRFYGAGDEPFSVEDALDRAAEVCQRVGVPGQHAVLELETQGASTKIGPDVWARGVSHVRSKGYPFRYWEIGNEVYAPVWGRGGAFPNPESYVEHFRAVSAAIRRAQPDALIGLSFYPGNLSWGNGVLQQTAGSYDFVVGHYYAGGDVHRRRFEESVLGCNYRILDQILRVNRLLKEYNPGRRIVQYDTEWGLHSSGPNGERADNVDRNANIIGTLHRAVRLIYYVREGMLEGASSWQMLSSVKAQGFGVLSQQAPAQRFMAYWLYYYFNRHVGDWVLSIEGTAPYAPPVPGDDPRGKGGEFAGPMTPAVATLSDDGQKMYLVMANGSWERSFPCRLRTRAFRAVSAEGVLLSHPDLDGKPLLERKEDLISPFAMKLTGGDVTCTLPAHSAAFVTLVRQGAAEKDAQ